MSRLHITQRERSIVVRGRSAGRILADGGFRSYFIGGTARGYMLDVDRLADLAAWLDYKNIPFEVTTVPGGDAA